MKSLKTYSIILLTISILLLIAILSYCTYCFFKNTPTVSTTIKEKINPNANIYGLELPYNTTEINFQDTKIDNSILQKLEQFSNLNEVNLMNQNLLPELQFELEHKYPNIKFKWNVKIVDRTIDSSIETLDLSNCKVENVDDFKKALSLLHNLKLLDMSDCNLSNEELAELRNEFPNIKIVWKIYFSVWSLKTDAIAFSVLISNFKYTYLTTKTIEVFKYCTDLQALDLGHQKITDISVIGDYLPNLRILILADNPVADISPLAKLKHLHYLELFITNVKDLSPLASCTELVDLNLCYDYNIKSFAPLIDNEFPLLERVWLNGCSISSNNLNMLRKKHPNAKITQKGPGSTGDGWRTIDRYFAMIDMFHKRDYISDLFTKYDS